MLQFRLSSQPNPVVELIPEVDNRTVNIHIIITTILLGTHMHFTVPPDGKTTAHFKQIRLRLQRTHALFQISRSKRHHRQ